MSDLDSDDLANVALLLEADRKRKKRSKWCKSWLQKRDKLSHHVLLEELRSEPKGYLNCSRMDEPNHFPRTFVLGHTNHCKTRYHDEDGYNTT